MPLSPEDAVLHAAEDGQRALGARSVFGDVEWRALP